MKKDLESLRQEIDDINNELLKLLNLRVLKIKEIAEIKDKYAIDYFDSGREEEMLRNIILNNKGPLPNELVRVIFTSIFNTCLCYMGISRERKLLVDSCNNNNFKNIYEIFNIQAGKPIIIAGPCAIEDKKYLEDVARIMVSNNIKFLRGGTFKPRTSPYEFQGLKERGLKILYETGRKYNLITITEVVDTRDVELVSKYTDILQIGARNMQCYELLKETGQTNKPVLLKRGISATIQELIYAAEYIALQGNRKIILCERGIRTFETKTRNTLDIASIPILKKETSLPVIADLSHSLGRKDITCFIAKAVLAAGADGIMVEVHPHPELALSDSKQQLDLDEFVNLLKALELYKNSRSRKHLCSL
jgi:3-deoxy-7-phosphoheptulonate synthase/chorismate mutase